MTAMKGTRVGWKRVVLLAGVVILISVAYMGMEYQGARRDDSEGAAPGTTAPRKGGLAPDFVLPDLSGKTVRLSGLRGKVVFLNFWATWCPPCRWERPSMEALFDQYKGRDFAMLAINVDEAGTRTVKDWVDSHHLQVPVLKDGDDLPVSTAYRTYSIPATFIIDKKGVIVDVVRGARKWDKPDVRTMIDGLLGSPASGEKPTATSPAPCAHC